MPTRGFPRPFVSRTFPLLFSSRAFPLDFDVLAIAAAEFCAFVEIDWPAGTERYSFDTTRPAGAPPYVGLLESVSTISRDSPPIGGQYTISDVTINLKNADGYFSTIKGSGRVKNVNVRILFGDPQLGLAMMPKVFDGRITSGAGSDDGIFSISCRSVDFNHLNQELKDTLKRVQVSVFPDLPADQKSVLVPFIIGDVRVATSVNLATYTGGGPCPCYLIDADAGGKWRYVVAQHVCKSIVNVFVYGARVTVGFTATTASYDGVTMQVLDFDADPRISDRSSELEVTASVQGWTSDGTASGTLIENPVTAFEDLFTDYAMSAEDSFNSVLMTVQRDRATSAGYKAAFVLTKEEETWGDVVAKFHESFLLSFYTTVESEFAVYLKLAGADATAFIQLSGPEHMLAFRYIFGEEEPATHIRYMYGYNWVREFYDNQPRVATGETFGTEDFTRNLGLIYVRDSTTADLIESAYEDLLAEAVEYQEIEIIPDYYREADLNVVVGLTHQLGSSSDGLGYVRENVRVVGVNLDPDPNGTKITLRTIKQA